MLAQWIHDACVLEASVAKPGNVSPDQPNGDLTWTDFVVSAQAIAPLLGVGPPGQAMLHAIQATRAAVDSNTNLGIVLLLGPLCAVPLNFSLKSGIEPVLDHLNAADAAAVYKAIVLARPGGLGHVDQADVRMTASSKTALPHDLVAAMRLTAGRDSIARQYVTGFTDVLDRLAPALTKRYQLGLPLNQAILETFMDQLAHEPDSLIQRKQGLEVARQIQALAQTTSPDALDRQLRQHRPPLNPGTSADLIAAALFVALREKWIELPARWPPGTPEPRKRP